MKTIESLVAKACANEKVNALDDTVRTIQVLKTKEELGESSEGIHFAFLFETPLA